LDVVNEKYELDEIRTGVAAFIVLLELPSFNVEPLITKEDGNV
jgi:hypothetical protein